MTLHFPTTNWHYMGDKKAFDGGSSVTILTPSNLHTALLFLCYFSYMSGCNLEGPLQYEAYRWLKKWHRF